MHSTSKIIGGTLLVIGTSIGGGMLALPVSTAPAGFFNSLIFLVLCWFVMTSGALLILEINLTHPPGSNIISMVKASLGKFAEIVTWILYLTLLYTLLAAYISGGSDVLENILRNINITVSYKFLACIFTLLLGLIVYSGIGAVDLANRAFMFFKLIILVLLIVVLIPNITFKNLYGGHLRAISQSLLILATSFGFGSIVPSLRDYFQDDIPTLRKIIIFGSMIPLITYILWNAVIMGLIAHPKLIALYSSQHSNSELIDSIDKVLRAHWIGKIFAAFSSICMLTAFLGVAIGLFDFLADGLHLKKNGAQGKIVFITTFLPPLITTLFFPGMYIRALNYAGACCIILFLLLPALMALKKNLQITGGKKILFFILIVASVMLLTPLTN